MNTLWKFISVSGLACFLVVELPGGRASGDEECRRRRPNRLPWHAENIW